MVLVECACNILVPHVAGLCLGLEECAVCILVGVDLIHILENAVGDVTVEVRERQADDTAGKLADLVAGAVQGGLFAAGALDAEVGEDVLVPGEVGVDVIVQVADLVAVAEVELDAAVDHGAEVSGRCGVTGVTGNGHCVKHSGSQLVVNIDAGGEFVAPHAEVESEVGLDGLFPLDAGVHEAGGLGAEVDGLGAVGAGAEYVIVAGVGIDRIAEITDAVAAVDPP